MRRSFAIIFWILIGALASGASIGLVLRNANADRGELLRSSKEAEARIISLERSYQENLNHIQELAKNLGRAEDELEALKNWQRILKETPPLLPPPPARLKGWSEFASVPMGVAIRVPTGSQARTNDDGLFLRTQPKPGRTGVEEQWLVLVKYNPLREKDFYTNSRVSTSGSVNYSLDNHLIEGTRGTFADREGTNFILSVKENTSSTYLVWAKTVPGVDERTILDTLATLSFR